MRTSIIALLVTGILLAVPTTSASPPSTAEGRFVGTGVTVNDARSAGDVTILRLRETFAFTGVLDGNSVLEGTLRIRSSGEGTFKGFETFSGTVAGRSGTLVWQERGSFNATSGQARFTIVGGTGELADLRGEGSFQAIVDPEGIRGTYTVNFHWEP